MKQRFINHIESIEDTALRICCREILNVPAFFTHPAARRLKHHHAYEGGLLAHTVEMADIALGVADMRQPMSLTGMFPVNLDILITAALFHDFAKIHEYAMVDGAWVSTSYRDTIGHIAGSAAEFILAADMHGVDRQVMGAVTHCILAHHGRREWGSPVEPQTVEALILHQADMLSAKYGATKDLQVASPRRDNVERLESGEVVYVHSDDCGGFCDYACNGSEGDRLATQMNTAIPE